MGERIRFSFENESHYVTLDNITAVAVKIDVTSETQQATLSIGDQRYFEVSGDQYYDLSVKLNYINLTSYKASITIKQAEEELLVTTTTTIPTVTTTTIITTIPSIPEVVEDYAIYLIIIIVAIIIIIGWLYYHGHRILPIGKPKPIHR